MDNGQRPHPIVKALFFLFLIVFFGGGLLLIVNLFVPFLPEAAFAIVALVIGAMLVVLAIVGKCVAAIRALRHATKTGCSAQTQRPEERGRP